MKKITIIDYGCGNILNLIRAIQFLGYEVETTHDEKKILNSSHVILPGVGAFGNAVLDKFLESEIIQLACAAGPPAPPMLRGKRLRKSYNS